MRVVDRVIPPWNTLRFWFILRPMKKVLLVSPVDALGGKEREMLEREDIEVQSVRDGREALDYIKDSRPDIVVAELNMPDISGDQVCTAVKSAGIESYVILASSGKKSDLKTCGRCNADAHIQTPIDPEDLAKRLLSILRMPVRRATRVLVKVQVQGSIKQAPFFSVSQNISVSGMMLETDQTLATGDLIECSFYLPESERLIASCRVVRVVKASGAARQYGVEFASLDEKSRATINEFISREREAGNFF